MGLFEIKDDNTDEVIDEKNKAIMVALEIIGGKAEDYAKGFAPVDTGNLRNSITHEVSMNEQCVYVGTNVEYAPYQEYGTYKMMAANSGRGYLRPAIESHLDEFKDIVQEQLM